MISHISHVSHVTCHDTTVLQVSRVAVFYLAVGGGDIAQHQRGGLLDREQQHAHTHGRSLLIVVVPAAAQARTSTTSEESVGACEHSTPFHQHIHEFRTLFQLQYLALAIFMVVGIVVMRRSGVRIRIDG